MATTQNVCGHRDEGGELTGCNGYDEELGYCPEHPKAIVETLIDVKEAESGEEPTE